MSGGRLAGRAAAASVLLACLSCAPLAAGHTNGHQTGSQRTATQPPAPAAQQPTSPAQAPGAPAAGLQPRSSASRPGHQGRQTPGDRTPTGAGSTTAGAPAGGSGGSSGVGSPHGSRHGGGQSSAVSGAGDPGSQSQSAHERHERAVHEGRPGRTHAGRGGNGGNASPGSSTDAGAEAQALGTALEGRSRDGHGRGKGGKGGGKGGGHGGKHKEGKEGKGKEGKEGSGGAQGGGTGAGNPQVSRPAQPAGQPPAIAASALAPSAPGARPATALVPQVSAAANQPAGAVGATRARQRARRSGRRPIGGGAALAATAGTAAGLAAVAPAPVRAVRLAAHARAVTGSSSNPLEGIGKRIPLPIPVPDWSKPIILALLLLALWLGVRSRLAALRARRLERQRVTLMRELDAMQAALVPEVPARLAGLDVSVAYRPAEGPAAGGDFYDLFAPTPDRVAFMLGDVAGHGHDALTHAALVRYTLRAYLQAGLEPRAALALAGQVLVEPLGERYATVAVGVFDAPSGTLTYALAGHPAPILLGLEARRPSVACSSPPIGWGWPTGRRQTMLSLPAGAEACFFSDGLVEARSGGELLGAERLREILGSLGPRPAAEQLLGRVRAEASETLDDMIACVLSPQSTAGGRRVHHEELEVDAQALAKADVRRFLRECRVPADEIAPTIQLARSITASRGSALIRVELGPIAATATVTAPIARRRRARSRTAVTSAGEPLLHALGAA